MNDANQLVKDLLAIALDAEWSTQHAAENRYCGYCQVHEDEWRDQEQHHPGCKWVATVAAAKAFLAGQAQSLQAQEAS